MKRAFIIHQWGSNPDKDFYPWLKKELENNNFEVRIPEMPETDVPKIELWVPYLEKAIGQIDGDTYLIGHSVGCQTILRYLETLSSETKIGGVIFVAGWFKLQNLESEEEILAKPWLEIPIDFQKIKTFGANSKFRAILSDNDRYGPLEENKEIFENMVGATVRVESGKGHFTEDDNITEVPEVLEELLKMANE